MPKPPSKFGKQADLPLVAMELPDESAHMVVGATVMAAIQRIMKEKNLSREQLSEWLTKRRGRQVTMATVNDWFAPVKIWHHPDFTELVLMVEFIGSIEPLNVLVQHVGAMVIDPRDQSLLEIGRTYLDKRRLEIRQDRLDEQVQGIIVQDMRDERKR